MKRNRTGTITRGILLAVLIKLLCGTAHASDASSAGAVEEKLLPTECSSQTRDIYDPVSDYMTVKTISDSILRSGPGTQFARVVTLKKGTLIMVMISDITQSQDQSHPAEWYFVNGDGARGYIYSKQVVQVKNEQETGRKTADLHYCSISDAGGASAYLDAASASVEKQEVAIAKLPNGLKCWIVSSQGEAVQIVCETGEKYWVNVYDVVKEQSSLTPLPLTME
ncbi:MAG: hypothetical protein PHW04_15635 [Candidatus Wallbacteria bacterium]|nr:hypothetical protein [Candidatus Wallbacteria bacterium]